MGLTEAELLAAWGQPAPAALGPVLVALCEAARTDHPELPFDDGALVTALARLAGDDAVGFCATCRPADFALAHAASRGDAAAIRTLERTYAGVIGGVCRRFAARGHGEDDLRQILRDKLLVGDQPTLASYNGQGSLGTWLRVVATRLFIDLGRRRDRAREAPTSDGLDGLIADRDLGLDVIKAEYRAAVAEALRGAALQLAAGDRHLLRQHLVAGLTIDQLAAVLGIHRATAARRIASAREQLAARARARLVTTLRLDDHELAEVFGLVVSRLDLSMRTLLASQR